LSFLYEAKMASDPTVGLALINQSPVKVDSKKVGYSHTTVEASSSSLAGRQPCHRAVFLLQTHRTSRSYRCTPVNAPPDKANARSFQGMNSNPARRSTE